MSNILCYTAVAGWDVKTDIGVPICRVFAENFTEAWGATVDGGICFTVHIYNIII